MTYRDRSFLAAGLFIGLVSLVVMVLVALGVLVPR